VPRHRGAPWLILRRPTWSSQSPPAFIRGGIAAALAAHNAQTQRLLWASTGTTDANYSDVKYVNELVGRDTISAMSMNTLNAYRDHGAAAPTLEKDLLEVAAVLGDVETLGINLEQVSMDLEREGLASFSASMNALLTHLASAG